MSPLSAPPLSARLAASRSAGLRHHRRLLTLLSLLLLAAAALTLCLGQSVTPPADVLRVLAGQSVPGASFTVGTLRLPRLLLAAMAGMAFGLGGASVQTLLRNPLASPDIIGITSGAATAAVFGIVVLGLGGVPVQLLAVAAGLGVAALVYLLSWRGGVAGARLILVGIGLSAMLQSATAYILLKAPAWSLQEAMRWLTGSVNGAQLAQALPLLLALLAFGALLLSRSRDLEAMRLGDDAAAALGVRLGRVRLLVTLGAVGLISTATALTGPISFVAFLAGPIAARICAPGRPVLLPAALVGALLVVLGDYAGQFLLPARYPVGVVTGVLGAPYLIYLITRVNRTGGGLA
ncbi:MAG: iron ABC transporter permease [Rhodobacteraceae bacterium]|nr:iron ABC transporter permease [Paracoccaceae bacterium]MBR9820066.1 iron ABC transporter permease [Paracoccaceae bacterium]